MFTYFTYFVVHGVSFHSHVTCVTPRVFTDTLCIMAHYSLMVTVESFAAHLTINDDGLKYGDLIPEGAKLASVKRQVCATRVYKSDNVLISIAGNPSI